MHVLGTAGHVDHGKSSLVRALTGTNPDRWVEERLRGMTLDLGFAHLRFDDGVEAGIVDVPGHERFLHNMLAGAAGMEMLLLVVAANEGPKQQTAEHLAILQYLNVKQTIVVLSKADTVDAEELAFAEELVREALAGTLAAAAPVLPVSVLTGAGLEELRRAIHAGLLELAPRAPGAPAYLPIDRVFALAGYGTVVTGTLMQGRIATGDRLLLTPLEREVRVRSLQVFGRKRESVDGGSRVAVNLPGVDTNEIARGAVLASSQFVTRSAVAVRFRALPAALDILKRRMPVRAYIGAAEILGTLVFDAAPRDALEVTAYLHLRSPVVVFPGAAFVVRRLSPKTLLGGGTIAAVDDVPGGAQAGDSPELAAVVAALLAAGLEGANPSRVGAAVNLHEQVAAELLARLTEDGRAARLHKPAAYLDGGLADELVRRTLDALTESERGEPWLPGLTGLRLARRLDIPEPVLTRVLATAVDEGRLGFHGGYYATLDFVPQLSSEQGVFFAALFAADAGAPYLPRPLAEVRAALQSAGIPGVSQAFEMLLLRQSLVAVEDSVYRAEQIAGIRAKLEAALRKDKQISMATFRDLTGTSRKYAVPLLEWFDSSGVTVRAGDMRVLRITPPGARRSMA